MDDPSDTTAAVGAAYENHYALLRFIAVQRFRVPADDVASIIHDVFVAYLRHASVVRDPRRWLAEALRNACRNYWRDRKPTEPLSVDVSTCEAFLDEVSARIDAVRLLASISDDCRALLYLRFIEELQPVEIASRCGVNAGHARVDIHRCLEKIRTKLRSSGS